MAETWGGGEMREGKEQEPKIKVEFFFAPHRTAEDVKGLAERIKKCDVYVPEALGWNRRDLELFNDVAQGNVDPLSIFGEELMGMAKVSELVALYNTKKVVMVVDMSENSPISDDSKRATVMLEESIEYFLEGNTNEAIDCFRKAIKLGVRANRQRENWIVRQSKERLPQLKEEYPFLKDRAEIKVLVSLGSSHGDVYKRLRKDQRFDVGAKYNQKTTVFSRNLEYGRMSDEVRKNVSNEFVLRAIIEILISTRLSKIATDSTKTIWAARALTEKLTEAQMIAMSHKMATVGGEDYERDEVLEDELKKAGVVLPKTAEEIEKLAR